MVVKNLTPHNIVVILGEEEVVIPASGILVRVATLEEPATPVIYEGVEIPVVKTQLKDLVFTKDGKELTVEEVREELRGVDAVVVPLLLKDYVAELKEAVGNPNLRVFSPNTSRAVRDEQGRIKGVPSLVELG